MSRKVFPEKIVVVHNWADSQQIAVAPRRDDHSVLQVVYSGNLGLAHDLDTVTGAMLALRDDARFNFTFIGGGSRRAELTSFIKAHNIQHVRVQPYVARADLGETLGLGDIGLVTQRDDCCGSVVPSKIYGLMAAGRPVLFIGPAAATPARIIQEHSCGWRIACGDTAALVQLLSHLVDHPEELALAGSKARHALETNYDRTLGTSRIIAVLTGETDTFYTVAEPFPLTTDPASSLQS